MTQPGLRPSRSVWFWAIGSIAVALVLAYGGFRASVALIQRTVQTAYLDQGAILADVADLFPGTLPQVLKELRALWERQERRPADAYLCVVDRSGRLVLHTQAPETVGSFIGDHRLLSESDSGAEKLMDLVHAGVPYVGAYRSSAGSLQVAAFYPAPRRGLLIGVHRSAPVLRHEVLKALAPLGVGACLLAVILMPLAFWSFFRAVSKAHRGQRFLWLRLREREAVFKAFMDHLPAACFIVGEDGCYQYVNPHYENLFGDRETVLGKTPEQIFGRKIGERIADLDRDARDRGQVTYEMKALTKSGEYRVLLAKKFLIPAERSRVPLGTVALDVTELHEARRRAEASEKKLNAVVAAAPMGICVLDLQRIQWCNEAAARELRAEAPSLPGRPIEDFLQDGEALRSFQWAAEACSRRLQPEAFNIVVKRQDGTVFPARIRLALLDPESPQGPYLALGEDISRELAREENLHQLNWILSFTVTVHRIISAHRDPEPFLQAICEAFAEDPRCFSAYAVLVKPAGNRELAGHSGLGGMADDLRLRLEQGMPPHCVQGVLECGEPLKVISGSECEDCFLSTPEAVCGVSLRLEHEGVVYGSLHFHWNLALQDYPEHRSVLQSLAEDIAVALRSMEVSRRREAAEEALRESEALLKGIIQAVPSGIATLVDERPDYVSERFGDIFGHRAMEFRSLSIREFFADREEFDRLCRNVREALHDKKAVVSETLLKRTDGSGFYGLLAARPLELRDRCLHWVLSVTDISESKEMERRVLEAQKMEALATLAAGIAHDFNNILMPIAGYAQMGMERLPQGDPLVRPFQQILAASHRAKDLVSQILQMSRKESSPETAVDLVPLIKETVKFLRASIPSHIDIVLGPLPQRALVRGSPSDLHQVLMNLATNAYHAVRERHGTITLLCQSAEPEEVPPEVVDGAAAWTKVSVTDDGVGIPEEIRDKIFEPYFTTRPRGEGTGLGLAVVLSIVEKLGGSIRCHSEGGKGARFDVFLPDFSKGGREVVEPRHFTLSRFDCTALVVDDDEAVLKVLTLTLRTLVTKVTSFQDPEAALEAYRKSPTSFDLVVTDLTMPRMNGLQFAQAVREIHPHRPVILLTGYQTVFDHEDPRLQSVDKVLFKPVLRDELARTIRELLPMSDKEEAVDGNPSGG